MGRTLNVLGGGLGAAGGAGGALAAAAAGAELSGVARVATCRRVPLLLLVGRMEPHAVHGAAEAVRPCAPAAGWRSSAAPPIRQAGALCARPLARRQALGEH